VPWTRQRAARGAPKVWPWCSQVVGSGRAAPDAIARSLEASPCAAGPPGPRTWAALMRRVFDLDLLACSWCGGRLRVIATVQDPLAGQAILAHRARSGAPRRPAPPNPAPPHPRSPQLSFFSRNRTTASTTKRSVCRRCSCSRPGRGARGRSA